MHKEQPIYCRLVAFPAGFEPTAFRLGGGRSILLSYGNMFWCSLVTVVLQQLLFSAVWFWSFAFVLATLLFCSGKALP